MGASLSSALDREPGAGLTKKDVERLKKRSESRVLASAGEHWLQNRPAGTHHVMCMLLTQNHIGDVCRFKRLSGGSEVLSAQQFELIPELAGNPFLPRLFEMFAKDQSQISQVQHGQTSATENMLAADALAQCFSTVG